MKKLLSIHVLVLIVSTAALSSTETTSTNLTVACVGDQGTGDEARAVLQLIAEEDTDLLLIQGDLGYDRGAA